MQQPKRKGELEYLRSMLEIKQIAKRMRRELRVWKTHLSSPRTNVSQAVDQNGRRRNAVYRLSALTDYYKSLEVRSLAIGKRGTPPQENLPGAFSIEDAIEHLTTQHGLPAITSTETPDCWLHRLLDAVQETANMDEAFVKRWESIITARMEYVQKRAQQLVDDHDCKARPSRQHLKRVEKNHEGAVHVFKYWMSRCGIKVPRQTKASEYFRPSRPHVCGLRCQSEQEREELRRAQRRRRQTEKQPRITTYFKRSGRRVKGRVRARGSLGDAFDWDGTGFESVDGDEKGARERRHGREGFRTSGDVSTIRMKITDFYVEGDESLEGDLLET